MTSLCYLFSKVNGNISTSRVACCRYRRCSRLCTFPWLGPFVLSLAVDPSFTQSVTSSLTPVSRTDKFLWRERIGECCYVLQEASLSCMDGGLRRLTELFIHMCRRLLVKKPSLFLWGMNTTMSFSRNKHPACLKQTHIRPGSLDRPKTF